MENKNYWEFRRMDYFGYENLNDEFLMWVNPLGWEENNE